MPGCVESTHKGYNLHDPMLPPPSPPSVEDTGNGDARRWVLSPQIELPRPGSSFLSPQIELPRLGSPFPAFKTESRASGARSGPSDRAPGVRGA